MIELFILYAVIWFLILMVLVDNIKGKTTAQFSIFYAISVTALVAVVAHFAQVAADWLVAWMVANGLVI